MELIHSGIYFYMKQKPFPKLYRERFLLFLSVGDAARYFFALRKNSDTNACVCITPRQDTAILSGVAFLYLHILLSVLFKQNYTNFVSLVAARTSIMPVSPWKNTVRPKFCPVSSATILILYAARIFFTAATFLSPMLNTAELTLNI